MKFLSFGSIFVLVIVFDLNFCLFELFMVHIVYSD